MPHCCVSRYTKTISNYIMNVAYVIFKKEAKYQNILYGFICITWHNVKAETTVTECYFLGEYKLEGWGDSPLRGRRRWRNNIK